MEVHQATIFFSGHVQGVGFRHQVFLIAKGFECTGWVKNLADGRVQLYLEGEKDTIRAFTDAVLDELDVFIKTSEETRTLGKRVAKSFKIVP